MLLTFIPAGAEGDVVDTVDRWRCSSTVGGGGAAAAVRSSSSTRAGRSCLRRDPLSISSTPGSELILSDSEFDSGNRAPIEEAAGTRAPTRRARRRRETGGKSEEAMPSVQITEDTDVVATR